MRLKTQRKILKNGPRRSMDGVAVLEFAFILPLLLILLFGIIEMSLVSYNQAMITNAAREGARFGILFNVDSSGTYTPHSLAEIQTVVDNYLQNHLISFAPSSASVTTPTVGAGSGDPLTVRVEYTYTFLILPRFATALAGDVDLVAEAVMRME